MAKKAERLLTPVGMLAFDKNLFTPDEEKNKYAAAIVLDKESDLKAIDAEIERLAKEKFGDDVEMDDIIKPYKEVTKKKQLEKSPFLKGKYVLNAKNGFELPVVDRTAEEISRDDIKGGDDVRFSVSFYAWEYNGKEMVCANLLAVQKVSEGEALFSKPTGKDFFSVIAENEEDDF